MAGVSAFDRVKGVGIFEPTSSCNCAVFEGTAGVTLCAFDVSTAQTSELRKLGVDSSITSTSGTKIDIFAESENVGYTDPKMSIALEYLEKMSIPVC